MATIAVQAPKGGLFTLSSPGVGPPDRPPVAGFFANEKVSLAPSGVHLNHCISCKKSDTHFFYAFSDSRVALPEASMTCKLVFEMDLLFASWLSWLPSVSPWVALVAVTGAP